MSVNPERTRTPRSGGRWWLLLTVGIAALAIAVANADRDEAGRVSTVGRPDTEQVATEGPNRSEVPDDRSSTDHTIEADDTGEDAGADQEATAGSDTARTTGQQRLTTIAGARPPATPRTGSGGTTTPPAQRSPSGPDGPAPTAPSTPEVPGPSVPEPPSPEPTAPEPPEDPVIDDDLGCRNLGRLPIGATGDDPALAAAGVRFRSAAAAQASSDALVCADPLHPWRDDLYIQRLFAAGQPYGWLAAGRGPDDVVVQLTETEWAGWGWRSDHNFVGVPTGRETIGGVPVIRTHRGGVVMVHDDAMGIPVVNGAWQFWMARGGPRGEMGLPVGRAQGSTTAGAWQDFQGGRIILAGIEIDLEAEDRPADQFQWATWSTLALAQPDPPIAPHSVIEIAGASYYVGEDGRRHWIETGGDWYCARDQGAALRGNVQGSVMDAFPFGDRYRCPT